MYAYNHGEYSLTPFDSTVPEEYFVTDEGGTLAIAPIVLDITDAMRERAKQAYLEQKKAEHARILELAAAAKARREERPAPVYPWDEPAQP